MANPVKISELFDLRDQSSIKELEAYAIKIGEAMQRGLESALQKNNALDEAIKRQAESLKTLQKESEKLNSQSKQSTDQLEKQAIASVKYQQSIEKLKNEKEKNAKQTQKLREEIEKLKNAQKGSEDETKKQVNSIQALRDEIKKSKKAYENLEGSIDGNNEALTKAKQRYIDAKTKLGQYNKSMRDATLLNRENEKSVEDLVKELNSQNITYARTQTIITTLNKRLRSMPLDALEKDFDAIANASKTANKRLEEFDDKLGQQPRKIGRYGDVLNGLKGGLGGLTGGLAAGFATGGIAFAVTEGIQLLGEGFTALKEIVSETSKELNLTNKVLGFTGSKLIETTANINATSKTFGVEYKDTLKAVNSQAKAFGITVAESNEQLNELLILSGESPDELLEQVKEYSVQFADANLTAEQFNNTLLTASKLSTFNDKAPDTIKEFALRMSALTPATKQALGSLGDFGKEAEKLFKEGETDKALEQITKGLKDLEDQGKDTKDIVANIFGGAGEDLGTENLIKIGEGINNVNKELTDYQKTQLNLLEANKELAQSEAELADRLQGTGTFFDTIGTNIKTFFIDAIVSLIDYTRQILNNWTNFYYFLRDTFSPIFDAVGSAIDFVVDGFKSLIESNSDAISGFKTLFNAVYNVYKFLYSFTEQLRLIPPIVAGGISAFKELFRVAGDGFEALVKFDFDKLKKLGKGIVKEFKTTFDDIQKMKEEAPNPLNFEETGKKKKKKGVATTPTSTSKGTVTKDAKKTLSELEKINKEFQEKKLKKEVELLQKGVEDKKLIDAELIKIEIEKNEKIKDLMTATNMQKLEAEKRYLESKKKLKEIFATEEVDEIKQLEEQFSMSDEKFKQELLRAEIDFKNGKIKTKEEYNKKVEEINNRRIQSEIEFIKKEIELRKLRGEDITKLETELLEKQNEMTKQMEKEKQKPNFYDILGKSASEFLSVINEIEGLVGNQKNKKLFGILKLIGGTAQSVAKLKGFHDGGYTGDSGEYEPQLAFLHGQEHVITKNQTDKYSMKGWTAQDFDKAVENGYFNQFSEIEYAKLGMIQAPKNDMINYSEIGRQVAKNVPRTDLKVLTDGIHLLEKDLGKVKEYVYKKDTRFRK